MAAPLAPSAPAAPAGGFARLLLEGVADVDRAVAGADALVEAFAAGDAVPLHHVTLALEEARHSTELMMQVRARLLEGYQELMRMQL
jgi:flagellar hook-basal body complex protein FliE